MGRSSGGAFDGAITSAYGSSGKEEPFGPNVSDRPRRRTMDDPPSYYNSYWNRSYSNNQRSWSTERDQRRGEGTPAKSGFFVVFAFFSFFGTDSSLKKMFIILKILTRFISFPWFDTSLSFVLFMISWNAINYIFFKIIILLIAY